MRLHLALSALMISTASAEYATWTDKSGRTAEMELQSVSKDGDVNVGRFQLKNGTTVTLDAGKLSEADAKRLAEWKPEKQGVAEFYQVDCYPPKQSNGKSSFELYSYFIFYLESPLYRGIKQDSISSISCDISNVTKILPWREAENLKSEEQEKRIKFWQTGGPGLVIRNGNFDGSIKDTMPTSEKPRIDFAIILKNDEPIPLEKLEKSSFKAEIIAVQAQGLKEGEITIPKSDVGLFSKKEKAHAFGIFKLSLRELSFGPDDHLDLSLNAESPYSPSGIESPQLFSEGKPVKMLSDVTGSEITVKFKYWSGIKEVKVLCEKPSDSPGMTANPPKPVKDSEEE